MLGDHHHHILLFNPVHKFILEVILYSFSINSGRYFRTCSFNGWKLCSNFCSKYNYVRQASPRNGPQGARPVEGKLVEFMVFFRQEFIHESDHLSFSKIIILITLSFIRAEEGFCCPWSSHGMGICWFAHVIVCRSWKRKVFH